MTTDLAQLRELLAKSAAVRWSYDGDFPDGELISTAMNALPALLDELEALLTENEALQARREALEGTNVRLMVENERLRAELDEASPMSVCDRCKQPFRQHLLLPEEGNEWECFPCNERENARERAALRPDPTAPAAGPAETGTLSQPSTGAAP